MACAATAVLGQIWGLHKITTQDLPAYPQGCMEGVNGLQVSSQLIFTLHGVPDGVLNSPVGCQASMHLLRGCIIYWFL